MLIEESVAVEKLTLVKSISICSKMLFRKITSHKLVLSNKLVPEKYNELISTTSKLTGLLFNLLKTNQRQICDKTN